MICYYLGQRYIGWSYCELSTLNHGQIWLLHKDWFQKIQIRRVVELLLFWFGFFMNQSLFLDVFRSLHGCMNSRTGLSSNADFPTWFENIPPGLSESKLAFLPKNLEGNYLRSYIWQFPNKMGTLAVWKLQTAQKPCKVMHKLKNPIKKRKNRKKESMYVRFKKLLVLERTTGSISCFSLIHKINALFVLHIF